MSSPCSACDNQPAEGSGILLHPFPKCPRSSYAWLKQLKLLDRKILLESSKVCSKHFSADQFYLKVDDRGHLCNELKPDATPCTLAKSAIDEYPNFNEAEWKSLEQARNAYKQLKATATDSFIKMEEQKSRIQYLEMQNHALKDSTKGVTETKNLLETAPRSAHEYINHSQLDKQALTVEALGSIVCCLCFETNQHVARVSAFNRFGDQSFLSNVIEACFGLVIQETDFCTDVCEQCLVRIDITWQFYSKVNTNSKALNDLYNSMQYEDVKRDRVLRNILRPARKNKVNQLRMQQKNARKKKLMTKLKSDNVDDAEYRTILEPLIDIKQDSSNQEDNSISDSDSDSLPEHPFFADHTKSVYNCHLCPQTFDRAQTLHVHQLNAHQTDTEQILCHLCAKWFKPRHYNEHVRNMYPGNV